MCPLAKIKTCPTCFDDVHEGVPRPATCPAQVGFSPEAAAGEDLAYVREGDTIEIDIPERRLELKVSGEKLAGRRRTMEIKQKEVKGALRRYQRLVGSVANSARLEDF